MKQNMQINYHGYRLGADAFFANSEVDALDKFSKLAGFEVRKCVYPVPGKRVYYISKNGQLFGLIQDESKHIFVGYTINPRILHKDKERPTPGVLYGVKHYMTGKDTVVKAERMVYNTFVLGRWNDDVKLQFKDGDPCNISLDNLEDRNEVYDPLWTERMNEQAKVYSREFNRVVDYVEWFCKIPKDDAQDCVQDTFLWITSSDNNKPNNFVGAWMFWSKMNGMHYIRDNASLRSIEDWEGWENDKPIDVDILGMIKNEKHRDMLQMKLHGYTEREIAENYGTTVGTVRVTMKRAITKLRTSFLKDFKVLGIELLKSNHSNLFI